MKKMKKISESKEEKNIIKNLGRILYKQTVRIFANSGLRKIEFIDNLNNYLRSRLKPNFIITKKYGHKMFLDELDSLHLSVHRDWENFETSIIEKEIKRGDVVLDIGANIGFYSLIMGNLVGNEGKVYAFEADPTNFEILEKNVKINEYKNIILINKAVLDKPGKVKLYIDEKNTGKNTLNKGENVKYVEVEAIRLDDYFPKNKEINFIKMDIEGSEGRAIKGMVNLLKKNKNIKIISEIYPGLLDEIGGEINFRTKDYLEFLEKIGFKLYDINEKSKSLRLSSPKDILNKHKNNFTNLLCKRS